MDEKDFFAKLAGVGPDGKFSNYSQKKVQEKIQAVKSGSDKLKAQMIKKIESQEEAEEGVELKEPDVEEISDEPEGQLAVDVYSLPTSFIVEAPIAGVKADDIDIAITLDSISIRGKRSKEDADEEKDYIYQECFWGRFVRSITFPQEVDADRASASFKNGILKVIIPKIQRDKPKKLKVKSDL
ncbi:Hsp20/alpha crystallin family protein [Candidatus Wolfebacteria bacterium]|nr:Hsp20/alpha crystallin family protein [Candidatus Wolfebacteria bacterium]